MWHNSGVYINIALTSVLNSKENHHHEQFTKDLDIYGVPEVVPHYNILRIRTLFKTLLIFS